MTGRLRLVVLGMMGRSPFGGQTWLYLNWIQALRASGHDVYYVEDDTVWPYDPVTNQITDDCAYAVGHIARCMEHIGMPNRWAFRFANRKDACWGMSDGQLNRLYASSDALLNIGGATALRDEHARAKLRVYVETDPVTVELRLAAGDQVDDWVLTDHDVFATYAENYGAPDCGVPLLGIDFLKTRQPIDLDLWPPVFTPDADRFTTIGNYRQTGKDVLFQGDIYSWSKHLQWERISDLPARTRQRFELALYAEDPQDVRHLRSKGWEVRSPLQFSLDVFGAYPQYIRDSRAELTVAKDQNVRLRSGWFSERDVCYLASGKPVVAQETGFSNIIPTGEGLFPFTNSDEALEAVSRINDDYARQCKGARALAEEYFDGRKIAARLLEDIGLT
ncbi:MAG: glycosyltransferase [Nitriliruptorales bacterium]